MREKAVTLFKIARIDLEKQNYRAAFDRLGESYGINERLGTPDGLAAVGELNGQLLVAAGERERGRVVLEQARQAAERMGWQQKADALSGLIRSVDQSAEQ